MPSFNVWAASRTLKGRLGYGVGFRIAQRLNPNLTDDEWRAALAEARAILANKAEELSRSLSRKPIAGEIMPFPVKSPGGFIQQIEVYVKDRDTDLIEVRPFSYKTDTLRARAAVIKEVRQIFNDSIAADPTTYPEEVVGAAYVGTYELTLSG